MDNPFTTTFSKIPYYSYIETDEYVEILNNFNSNIPSESVYKITGVRGSGKSVLLSKLEQEINHNKKWVIYNLSSTRNLLKQLLSYLYNGKFIKETNKEKSLSINLNILGGGLDFSKKTEDMQLDYGTEIEEGLKEIKRRGLMLFIGIDDIVKNKYMVEFTSEFSKWLISGFPVYLVCTGLYENVNELSNAKNLTFFRRATTIKTSSLNTIKMIEMYKDKLNVSHEIADKLVKITKGYAYAFQKLGSLYFTHKDNVNISELISLLKGELYSSSYEKIWEELGENDKFFLKILKNKETYKRDEVINLMGNKGSYYSVYRDRLIKRGLIVSNDCGVISLCLPYFANYIDEYCN